MPVFAVSIERDRRKKEEKKEEKKEVGGIRRIPFNIRVAYPLTLSIYVYGLTLSIYVYGPKSGIFI